MFAERIRRRLLLQRESGLYRDPPKIQKRQGKFLIIGSRRVLSFASNDYLGLGASNALRRKIAGNFERFGGTSSSSRLVSGNYAAISEAEKACAEFFGYADALFFPSGYQANIGLLSTLFEPGDLILFDKHVHASSIKGIQLSGADFHGYKHNNMNHLQKRLEAINHPHPVVVTEALFSMDGDLLNIQELFTLKQRYGFLSIVDEAHSFGVLGEGGTGIAKNVADIAVGTFGKALGFFGAFLLLPEGHKEYLFNFCSPLIYSTTLPEAHGASALDILEAVSGCDPQRRYLRHISAFMKSRISEKGFKVSGDAHILSVGIEDETAALHFAQRLFKNNIFVFPARYPTVPLGKAILRLGMSTLHTEEDVDALVQGLCSAEKTWKNSSSAIAGRSWK